MGTVERVATLRAAQLALPPGIRTFAIRCGADELTRRRAGDLTVLDVPALDRVVTGFLGQ